MQAQRLSTCWRFKTYGDFRIHFITVFSGIYLSPAQFLVDLVVVEGIFDRRVGRDVVADGHKKARALFADVHAAFDLVGYYQEHVAKELSKKVNDGIKYILAHYIDNPFEDIVTMAGMKERNIISFVFDRYPPAPKFDHSDEKCVYLTMTSDFLGIRQGNMLIDIDGKRTQITETKEP